MHISYLSINLWNLYSAPSRKLLRGAPSRGPGKKEGLKETIKRARKITWKRAQFERKAIPDRGTSRREGPILFNVVMKQSFQYIVMSNYDKI